MVLIISWTCWRTGEIFFLISLLMDDDKEMEHPSYIAKKSRKALEREYILYEKAKYIVRKEVLELTCF